MDVLYLAIVVLLGAVALWQVLRFVWSQRRVHNLTHEARWNVRYERGGEDWCDSQWWHREHEMNQRQSLLDKSQDVMTRLV